MVQNIPFDWLLGSAQQLLWKMSSIPAELRTQTMKWTRGSNIPFSCLSNSDLLTAKSKSLWLWGSL